MHRVKMKTHKSSRRRLRITVNGKIVRRQGNVRHFMTNRSAKRKRNLRKPTTTLTKGYVRKLARALCIAVYR